jgi:hypothetical protein
MTGTVRYSTLFRRWHVYDAMGNELGTSNAAEREPAIEVVKAVLGSSYTVEVDWDRGLEMYRWTATKVEPPSAKIIDLFAALKGSLAGKRRGP